jgi:HK97 gp10 family phage protein
MPNFIEVEGLNQVLAELKRLKNVEIPRAIRQANLEAAELVVPTARAEAPKKSGKLAGSIKAKATKRAGSLQAGSAVRVPYAGPIHFGWGRRHIAPQPFLYRAVDKRMHEVYERYVRQLDQALRKWHG